MKKRVLIIGGYGNFGSYISRMLAQENDLQVIITGRRERKCRDFANQLSGVEWATLNINRGLAESLHKINPDIVIHTSGPYQGQGYGVADACINAGCHYIDLADGREFVENITQLNEKAKASSVSVISGASSVPALTSAILDHYLKEFEGLTEINYGISTAQHTNTGLATTSAVLGYAGKPFKTMNEGEMRDVYGWQDLHMRKYPSLGWRMLGNCDIPDLTLFPERYPDLKTQRFYAGLEVKIIHFGFWLMTWLVRWGLVSSWDRYAGLLLTISRLFDVLGSDNSAFHMDMMGVDSAGGRIKKTFTIIARDGHGPYIPTTPAILCAKMIARGQWDKAGAYPCMGIISLAQYIKEFEKLNICFHQND